MSAADRRLVLLHSTPRIAPGLLSADAWATLGQATTVYAFAEEPSAEAIAESVEVHWRERGNLAELARELVDAVPAEAGCAVWVGSADGDPGLNEAIASEVTRRADPPDVEVLVGSYDVPGARLLDVVAVMDRLRSPGGCPWDAKQTHASLLPYLLEESHEAIEAIESGDRDDMVEELGDLLLQIAFQSRVGQDDPEAPFSIDDVAGGLVDKLVRRHPHVFADIDAETADQVEANWDQIKAAEKPHREHLLDGVPASLPGLAKADAYARRAQRADRHEVVDAAAAGDDLGARLLALVLEAREGGIDPEAALRETLRGVHDDLT